MTTLVPLEVPDVKVTETYRDKVNKNRSSLIEVLKTGQLSQAIGAWQDSASGANCFITVAYINANLK